MHDRDRNPGFTLVEVLIVVGLIGLIALAISAVFTAIVRTNPSTVARVDDARSLLGITTYLPGDTSSAAMDAAQTLTDVSGADDSYDVSANGHWDRRQDTAGVIANVTPCAGYVESQGVNVLTLTWDEAGDTFRSHYRYASNDGSTWRLFRIYCEGSANAEVVRLTSQLLAPDQSNPAHWILPVNTDWKLADHEAPFGPGNEDTIVGAELSLATIDGETLRFDGTSNNPRNFLSPLPTGPGGGGGGPGACIATFSSIVPNPAKNQIQPNPNPGQDQDPAPLWAQVVVTITQSGTCGTLGVAYETTGIPQWELVGAGQVIIPASGTEIWADGSHPLILKDGQTSAVVLDTASLVVN